MLERGLTGPEAWSGWLGSMTSAIAVAIAGNAWSQCELAKLQPPDLQEEQIIGTSAAIDGDVAIIGLDDDSASLRRAAAILVVALER